MASQEKKILSIDDNKDILYTLEQICRFQGWTPLTAEGYDKGISRGTLAKIEEAMRGLEGYRDIYELESITEIKKKTLYR